MCKPAFNISQQVKTWSKNMYFPAAHPEPNPIEKNWSKMKDYVQKKMSTIFLSKVEQHGNDFLILLIILFGGNALNM